MIIMYEQIEINMQNSCNAWFSWWFAVYYHTICLLMVADGNTTTFIAS